jgi:hypothetical protein
MTSMNASASAVSRMLKADGLTITPRYYRFGGVSVSKSFGGRVCVIASLVGNSRTAESALIDEATEILTAHGYTVQRSSWNIAYASKEA